MFTDWSTCHTDDLIEALQTVELDAWDTTFVEDMDIRLSRGDELIGKQRSRLEKIAKKYL